LSEAVAETVMVPATVAPFVGAVRETVGGVVSTGGGTLLSTVTLTLLLVVLFPAASRAMAVRVWEPFAIVVVFQEVLWGLVVSSVPRLVPSSRNWTPTTPTLSEAVAETVTVPDTVAPLAGAVIVTVGGLLSTVTLTLLLVVLFPAASRATAVRVWEPLPTVVVFQERL
jgi:hypothetical protein